MNFNLGKDQLERYNRNIILQGIGLQGQKKIMSSKVLVIGIGGLGSAGIFYLAAAGIGILGLMDGDVVNLTNLQRQIIHFTADVGKPKVDSAKEKINQFNPDVRVRVYKQAALAATILDIIKEYDFVIDATDNFAAKFLINDACVLAGKPFSHGGILCFEGQTLTYIPGSACYRCVFMAPPPKNMALPPSQTGVLGTVAGILGTIQATEALKYITQTGEVLKDRLLIFNAKNMDFRKVKVSRNRQCPVCGDSPTITELRDEGWTSLV